MRILHAVAKRSFYEAYGEYRKDIVAIFKGRDEAVKFIKAKKNKDDDYIIVEMPLFDTFREACMEREEELRRSALSKLTDEEKEVILMPKPHLKKYKHW